MSLNIVHLPRNALYVFLGYRKYISWQDWFLFLERLLSYPPQKRQLGGFCHGVRHLPTHFHRCQWYRDGPRLHNHRALFNTVGSENPSSFGRWLCFCYGFGGHAFCPDPCSMITNHKRCLLLANNLMAAIARRHANLRPPGPGISS